MPNYINGEQARDIKVFFICYKFVGSFCEWFRWVSKTCWSISSMCYLKIGFRVPKLKCCNAFLFTKVHHLGYCCILLWKGSKVFFPRWTYIYIVLWELSNTCKYEKWKIRRNRKGNILYDWINIKTLNKWKFKGI